MKHIFSSSISKKAAGSAQSNDDDAGEGFWRRGTAEARSLAKKARQIARSQDVLFHATRYRRSVLASGKLMFAQSGSPVVSFTRSPDVAGDLATLPRDDDEGSGAILIFDRASLRTRYKLECHDDKWECYEGRIDEFEECVVERDVEISPHLIGLVAQPIYSQTAEARARNLARTIELAYAADDYPCDVRGRECPDCSEERHLEILDQFRRTHPNALTRLPCCIVHHLKAE